MPDVKLYPREDAPHVVKPDGSVHSLDVDTPLALWLCLAMLGVWVPRTWVVRMDMIFKYVEDEVNGEDGWYEVDCLWQAVPDGLREAVQGAIRLYDAHRSHDQPTFPFDPIKAQENIDRTIDRIRKHLDWLGSPGIDDEPWRQKP